MPCPAPRPQAHHASRSACKKLQRSRQPVSSHRPHQYRRGRVRGISLLRLSESWRECEFLFSLAYHLVYDAKGYAGILRPASSSSVARMQEAYGRTPEYWMLDDYTAGTSFVQ